jgi:ABC-type transport system involved in cytochrome c biogenesis permease component
MNGLLLQLAVSLRLHFRNRMALIYGYLFPTIFLVAFWVLYRYETPLLVRHMGELLTVTVLGGACFGMPTTMVSDRERGVWRRYRLTPVPTANLVASTVAARYLLLLTAGLLQLLLAMLIGMPAPRHPADLFVAFTFVSFAFLGLGLVIATMADTVPAVQALGQCIFLPMLIIGGVAVPLESLPDWAQHVSAFFPGRYAVEALKAAVMGDGLAASRFSLLSLLVIGGAGCLAGARLFRWDAQQRFSTISGKGWVAAALLAWAVVGVAAETRHRPTVISPASTSRPAPSSGAPAAVNPAPAAVSPQAPPATPVVEPPQASPAPPAIGSAAGPITPAAPGAGSAPASPATPVSGAPAVPLPPVSPAPAAAPAAAPEPADWQKTTLADIDREIDFTRVPPDAGVVTPIAPDTEEPDPEVAQQLETVRSRLPSWPPAKVPDPVQRTRNLLYVAAVPDVLQTPIERFTALVVFDQLQQDIPPAQLIQALFWVALHPMDGDDSAADQLPILGLDYGADKDETRNRAAFYAVKLLGRLTGKIVPK